MNFNLRENYIDVCIEYALSYKEEEISSAFSRVIATITSRYPHSNTPPIDVVLPFNEVFSSPTNIGDALWFFFGNRLTNSWPTKKFNEYYEDVKNDMVKCFVPFRDFDEQDFQNSMRLRVFQDSLNIIAGRKIDIPSKRKYSAFNKMKYALLNADKPSLFF